MPTLFAEDDAGQTERYAVAHYLASLGGPARNRARRENDNGRAASVRRGQALYNNLGCTACHSDAGKKSIETSNVAFITIAALYFPLNGLGSKTTPEKLAVYLENPLAHDPNGRMPRMLLQRNEAIDLARFLCESKVEGLSPELPVRQQSRLEDWDALGKRLVVAKGCVNCHAIQPGGKKAGDAPLFAALDDLKKADKAHLGCLANDAAKRGKAPDFGFAAADRDALAPFWPKD